MSNLVNVDRGSPRGRRGRANRQRIVAEAMAVMASEGTSGLTLARVGAAAHYSAAALYRYFPSKEALLAALTVAIIEEIDERIAAHIEKATDASSLATVTAVLAVYEHFAAEQPEKFGAVSTLLADARTLLPSEETARPALVALEKSLARLAALLGRATAAGELSDGDHAARAAVLFAATHGALQLRKQAARTTGLPSTKTLCAMAREALLRGWGAAP